MREAVGFPENQADLRAEGIPFSYLVALYKGTDGGVPGRDDAEYWADETGLGRSAPILSDFAGRVRDIVPIGGGPIWCALSPRMEFIDCWSGHTPGPDSSLDPLLDVIRDEWARGGG